MQEQELMDRINALHGHIEAGTLNVRGIISAYKQQKIILPRILILSFRAGLGHDKAGAGFESVCKKYGINAFFYSPPYETAAKAEAMISGNTALLGGKKESLPDRLLRKTFSSVFLRYGNRFSRDFGPLSARLTMGQMGNPNVVVNHLKANLPKDFQPENVDVVHCVHPFAMLVANLSGAHVVTDSILDEMCRGPIDPTKTGQTPDEKLGPLGVSFYVGPLSKNSGFPQNVMHYEVNGIEANALRAYMRRFNINARTMAAGYPRAWRGDYSKENFSFPDARTYGKLFNAAGRLPESGDKKQKRNVTFLMAGAGTHPEIVARYAASVLKNTEFNVRVFGAFNEQVIQHFREELASRGMKWEDYEHRFLLTHFTDASSPDQRKQAARLANWLGITADILGGKRAENGKSVTGTERHPEDTRPSPYFSLWESEGPQEDTQVRHIMLARGVDIKDETDMLKYLKDSKWLKDAAARKKDNLRDKSLQGEKWLAGDLVESLRKLNLNSPEKAETMLAHLERRAMNGQKIAARPGRPRA